MMAIEKGRTKKDVVIASRKSLAIFLDFGFAHVLAFLHSN